MAAAGPLEWLAADSGEVNTSPNFRFCHFTHYRHVLPPSAIADKNQYERNERNEMSRKGNKSELDSQRELLDSLMGINRNNDRKGDQVKDFRDERVCKFFLTGMCPHGKKVSLYSFNQYNCAGQTYLLILRWMRDPAQRSILKPSSWISRSTMTLTCTTIY